MTLKGPLFLQARLFTLGWPASLSGITVFTAHPGASLVASTGLRFSQNQSPLSLQAHWLIWFRCLLFCAISFWIQHCRRVCRAHTSGDGVAWENAHVVRNVCVLGEGCYLLRLLSILTFLLSLSVYRGGWG